MKLSKSKLAAYLSAAALVMGGIANALDGDGAGGIKAIMDGLLALIAALGIATAANSKPEAGNP